METVIIICLLMIIFLLIKDKAGNTKRWIITSSNDGTKTKHPSIMGKPKKVIVTSDKVMPLEVETKVLEKASEHIREIDPEEINVPVQISREALGEVLSPSINLEEEEEEWRKWGIMVDDINLAQSTTFEELMEAGRLLKSNELQVTQKEATVALVQKIQGTELFDLLENSVEGASKKIAELLDISLAEETAHFSSFIANDFTEFDINQFI